MKIAHISDVHFGRIVHRDIVEALVSEVNERRHADLVIVSGDLTQRARPREYQEAAEMMRAFRPPVIVVPGNHDVYPWWRPVSRMIDPLRRYREYISEELLPTFVGKGVAVAGLNSAFGPTIKGGRISRQDIEAAGNFFQDQENGTFRILTVHHHLLRIQALGPHDVARRAKQTLRMASECGVELILCGHLHISHVEPKEIRPSGHRVIVVSAGTATSNRGRRSNRKTNYYNLITVDDTSFQIEENRFDTDARCFDNYRTLVFRRR